MEKQKNKGFTLIELLVVISIIGMLSTVILASLQTARTKALYAKARIELRQLGRIISYVGFSTDKSLGSISNSFNSMSSCTGNLRNIPSGSQCYQQFSTLLTNLDVYAKTAYTGVTNLVRDPWGSPYLIDENEGEYDNIANNIANPQYCSLAPFNLVLYTGTGVPPGNSYEKNDCYCRHDLLVSAGPDGIKSNGDDIYFHLPFYTNRCTK